VAVARRERTLTPLDRLLGEAGVARRVVLTVPSTYGAMMAAGISDLVASVPDRIAHTVAAALDLVVFKLPVVVPPEQVVQAWHPRLDADPAHRWLRECVATLPARARHGPLRQRAHRAMLGIDER
jgi:DNA-binding transcriptional LysR family regulator